MAEYQVKHFIVSDTDKGWKKLEMVTNEFLLTEVFGIKTIKDILHDKKIRRSILYVPHNPEYANPKQY